MHIDLHVNGLSPLASPADSRPLSDRPDVSPIPPIQPITRDMAGNAENKIRTTGDAPERHRRQQSDRHTTDTHNVENEASEVRRLDVYA